MLLTITRFKNIYDGTIGKFELSDSNTLLLTGYTLEPAGKIAEFQKVFIM